MAEGGVSEGANENMSSENSNEVQSVKMLTELAADYSEYMQINCLKEVLVLRQLELFAVSKYFFASWMMLFPLT